MSSNNQWTKREQRKIVWEIIDREVIEKTKFNTKERADLLKEIADYLLEDSDFSARMNADNPQDTVVQHIRTWLGYFEGRSKKKPTGI